MAETDPSGTVRRKRWFVDGDDWWQGTIGGKGRLVAVQFEGGRSVARGVLSGDSSLRGRFVSNSSSIDVKERY